MRFLFRTLSAREPYSDKNSRELESIGPKENPVRYCGKADEFCGKPARWSNVHSIFMPIYFELPMDSPLGCQSLASWLTQLAEREPRTGVSPGFESRTRTNFPATKKLLFLSNPCGFPCSLALQTGGCEFSFRALVSTETCRNFLLISRILNLWPRFAKAK